MSVAIDWMEEPEEESETDWNDYWYEVEMDDRDCQWWDDEHEYWNEINDDNKLDEEED